MLSVNARKYLGCLGFLVGFLKGNVFNRLLQGGEKVANFAYFYLKTKAGC